MTIEPVDPSRGSMLDSVRNLFRRSWVDADRPTPTSLYGLFGAGSTEAEGPSTPLPMGVGMFALRGAATMEHRQEFFACSWADVVVDLEFDEHGTVTVSGQLSGTDHVCSVQLLDGTDELGLTLTDDHGEFTLRDVPLGRFELIVSADAGELIVTLDLSE